jgi:uncharacterized repeat protein (TIGR01451 family)
MGRILAAMALAGCLVLAGCQEIIRTHAKPPGLRYFHPLSHRECGLTVVPLEATSPARSQVVLVATVTDAAGKPLRDRRVEWLLEGAGNIIEVDESGYLPGRGYKVDNRYAVSHTDWFEHCIKRTGNAADDFTIRPGQTWCVITSAVEGDTQVTVYAPGIEDWNANRLVVSYHWIDAGYSLPTGAAARTGTQAVLTTNVFRHTDHQPLAGYRVRYRVLDGPSAILLPGRGPEAVAVTDINGNATVGVAQLEPGLGRNRVEIEVLRAPDPSLPSGSALSIGRGEAVVDWQAPTVSIAPVAPPTVPVGQDVTVTLAVTNSGPVATQAVTVRAQVPEGAKYVRSNPLAAVEGGQLVWTLASLASKETRKLEAIFHPAATGTLTSRARVDTSEGLRDEKQAVTQVVPPAAPELRIALTGPAQAVVVPGAVAPGPNAQPVTFFLAISNPGTGPAANVKLKADFDASLGHDSGANPVELALGDVAAGETKNVPLTLRPVKAGNAGVRVQATADGGLVSKGDGKVDIREAKLTVSLKGAGNRYVGRPVDFDVEVANAGAVPLGDVTVRDRLPPELGFTTATPPAGDGTTAGPGREIVWSLGTLQPGDKKELKLTAATTQVTPRAVNVVQAIGYPVLAGADPRPANLPSPLQAQAEAAVAVQGVPVFRMAVTDIDDPIEVGGHTTYQIDVTNQGSLPGTGVSVAGLLPPQMRFVSARGPAPYRVDGSRVVFAALDALAVGQTATFAIEAEATEAGEARFRAELSGGLLQEPLVKEESTNVR